MRNPAKYFAPRLPAPDLPIMVRLARGGFWSLVGEAGSRAFSFASAIVVARWLGVVDYGAFVLMQGTLAMLMTFAVFGTGHTTSRYIAALRNTDVTRVQGIHSLVLLFAALTGVVTTAVLFVAAPYLATTLLAAPELAGPLRTVAPVLLLYAITGAAGGTILGFEGFKQFTRIGWISGVGSFVAILVGISLLGLQGAITGLIVGELIRCALTVLLARQIMCQNGLQLLGSAHLREVKILWQFSLPLLLTSVLFASITWFCQAAIARQPDGLTEIGLYDAAQKCMTLVMLVPVAASAAFGPVLANLSGDGDTSARKRVTVNLAIVQLFLTAVPAASVALAAPRVLLVFGPGFVTASPVVLVTMALAPVYVLRHLYSEATISAGHAWTSFMLSAVWAAVASGLISIWQTGGAIALARAMLVAHGVTLLANVLMLEWFSRSGLRWKFARWGRKEFGGIKDLP
jgi:O-antigen/teichoic acid export membrane protein